jgi:AraC-like DNA-binding protein
MMLEKKQHKYAEILMSCLEEKYFKTEAVWEYHSFMRIISGEMKIVLADTSYIFNAGDTLLVPRNQLSTVIKRPKGGVPYKSILITFRADQLKDYYLQRNLHFTQPSAQKVRTYPKHPLLEFSYLTGRSIATFNRDFRKAFRFPPQKWLTVKRLEHAHYLLSEKKQKPVDVYYEAGFENLSHFSFAFKKHFGYAPTALSLKMAEGETVAVPDSRLGSENQRPA